jgi:hypothetical protein
MDPKDLVVGNLYLDGDKDIMRYLGRNEHHLEYYKFELVEPLKGSYREEDLATGTIYEHLNDNYIEYITPATKYMISREIDEALEE